MKDLQKLIDEKYISVQKHPTEDLYIYNYTQKAQFDKMWNEVTMQCRGLILDSDGKVVARPFKKFFNYGEDTDVPSEEFEVFEKYDGSLGIAYFLKGKPYLATRGSFISDQAVRGTKTLEKYDINWDSRFTYLFEIIYPSNRIVVDYGNVDKLVLLAIVNTETGNEVSYEELFAHQYAIEVATRYNGIKDLSKIKDMAKDNAEGFVIRFKSGKRLKVKFDEYVRLHRLVTGINARRIWDLLRNNQPIDELLDRVPDEFFNWVKDTVKNLKARYGQVETNAKHTYDLAKKFDTRKEQANLVLQNDYSGIVFQMLDGKDYSQAIWTTIKPKHEVPFKTEI